MKQQEFFQAIERYGIDLTAIPIFIGKIRNFAGAYGIYEKNGQWIFFRGNERYAAYEDVLSGENEAFDKILDYVFISLDDHNYITHFVTEDIVKIPKETVCAYIRDKYSMTEKQAEEAWEYLKQDMDVLFEFKYYIANGEFVPEKYCYKVKGYSAEYLYNTTYLEVIGAFNYLIYLRKKPEEALENLKKGLPRRTIITNTDSMEVQQTMDETTATPIEEQEPKQPEPVQPEEAKPEQPEAKTDGALLEKLDALLTAIGELKTCFDDKIAEDEHKNALFDNMHRELTRYQNGALEKIVETIALDIIQLVDTTKNHYRVYEKKEPTEENYKKLLRIVKGIGEDLDDILYRQSIESYRVPGHEVDVRRQKIIQTVPTDDQSKDNLVAVRVADGYAKGDKVLRPERIKIFKYEPAAKQETKEE